MNSFIFGGGKPMDPNNLPHMNEAKDHGGLDGISVDEYLTRVHSFRAKMGRADLSEEQRHNLLKMLNLSYLNVVCPTEEDRQLVADLHLVQTREYAARMRMLGMEP